MGIVDRIQMLCDSDSINFRKLEQELEFANGSIRRWDDNSPSCDKMLKISKRFNKSIDWIITGSDVDIDLLLSEDQRILLNNYEKLNILDKEKVKFFIEISLINLQPSNFYHQKYDDVESENLVREIPVIGYVAAGSPILALENNLSFIPPIHHLVSYALFVKGNSMYPVILDGEIIQIIPQTQLENGEIGIIKIGDEVTCKKFYMFQDRIELRSFNGDFSPLKYQLDSSTEFQIVGKVVLNEAQLHRFRL